MRTLAALVSLCFLFSAEAHQGRPRGKGHPHNHQHQPRECGETFVARSQADLADYESLRIQTGVDRKLHINTNITATDLRIQTDCEIKIHTKVVFNVTGVLALFAEKIDFGNKVEIRAKDFYVKTEKKIKFDEHLEITTQRVYIESAEEIRFKNKSILSSDVGIFNAPFCDVQPRATRLLTQELGTCFNKAPFLVDLKAAPVSGEAPLNVNFDASKSFGLLDTFIYHFGTGDTLQTLNEGAAYAYVTPGSFSARLEVRGSFGSLFSSDQTILVNPPVVTDFQIFHDIVRVNPPAVIYSTGEVPPLENLKEFLWDFGDNSSIAVPFTFSQVGFAFHDYAAEADYTVKLRLKNQADFVTAPVEKVVSTFADALPVPRYSINTFKGEAPLTVEVQALEATDAYGEPMRFQWFFTDTMESIALGSTREVQHTFTQPGIYQVQLGLTDSRGAVRSVLIPIYVGQANSLASLPPFPVIDSTERYGEAPLTVDFTAVSSFDPDGVPGQPLTYQWTFFDNGRNQNVSFFGQNFSYTFIKPAVAQVRLIVTDVTGQQGSAVIPVYVSGPTSNPGGFIVAAGSGARTYNFNINPFMIENTYSYESILWDFGDGTQSRFPNTPHVFPAVGDYPVTLKIRKLDGDFETYTQVVRVAEVPVAQTASISTNGNRYNLNEPKTFTALTNIPQDALTAKFTWHFGDGSSVSGVGSGFSSVSHIYSSPGQYRVTLHTQFASGLANYAQFVMNPNTTPTLGEVKIYRLPAIAPATVGFAPVETAVDTDGFVQTYVYEFGDGSTPVITGQGYLEHTYTQAGTYPVTITAIDNNGGRASRSFNFSVLSNQVPIARVTVYPQTALIAPARIGFAGFDQSSDGDGFLTQYEYDFGDGEILTTQEGYVEHDYPDAGTYRLGLRVRDDKGLWSDKAFYDLIIAANQIPIARMSVDVFDSTAPGLANIEVWRTSTDADGFIAQYEFDFGDGTTLTDSDGYEQHSYPLAGSYTIKVRVQDDRGAWSLPIEQTITIIPNQKPIAINTIYGSDYIAPSKLGMNAGVSSFDPDGYIATIEYDFGDGSYVTTTPAQAYVEHEYTVPGPYIVRVRVSDNDGLWSDYVSTSIQIKPNQAPIASFTATVFDPVAPGRVGVEAWRLSSDSDGYLTQFEYDLGDGTVLTTSDGYIEHEYLEAGTYSLRVRVQDDKQLWSEYAVKEVVIRSNQAPIVITTFFQSSQYAPAEVQVNAWDTIDTDGFITEYRFDFGDGTLVSSTQSFQQHIYTLPGLYLVKVEAIDNKGASGLASFQIEVTQNASPIAQFNLNPDEPFFVGREITASAFGSLDPDGVIVDYQIDWGDGARSSGVEVKHTYSTSGPYDIRLTLRDDFGNVSEFVRSINVAENSAPIAEIQVSPETLKQYEIVTFEAINAVDPEGHLISYSWEFSDEEKDYGKKVPKFFKEAGTFTAKLILIDQYGAKSEVVRTVEVEENDLSLPTPVIAVNESNGVAYQLVVADGRKSSSPLTAIASYEWDWGDGTALESGMVVSHEYEEGGEYTIKLKVTDTEGNSNTTFKVIQYDDIGYEYEVLSEAKLLVAGLDLKGFNPRSSRVEISLEGAALSGGLSSVKINGTEVPLIENSSTKIAFNAIWLDDRNDMSIETYDANGGKVAEEFVIYAGSRTIQFELSNVAPDTVLRLHHTENKDIFEEVNTSQNGVVMVANVPTKPTFVFASSPQGQISHDLISSSENALIMPMEDLASPVSANFDLSNGTAGWVSNQGNIAVVGSEQNKFAEISLSSGREAILSHTAQPNFNKPFIVSKREYRSTNPSAVVFSLLRDSSGRVEYSFARMSEGLLRNGEYFLTPDPLSIDEVQSGTLETRIALYSLESSTSSYSKLFDSVNAYAQQAPSVSGKIRTEPVTVKLGTFKLKAINWESGLFDVTKKLSNRDACGIGFSVFSPPGFDSNDQRFSVIVSSALTQELEIVGVVGSWQGGDGAPVGGIKAIMTAENSRIGPGDVRCILEEVPVGATPKRICKLGAIYDQPISTAMTQANPGNFQVAFLDQRIFQGERINLKLVVMTKEKFEELGGGANRMTMLNDYQQISSIEGVQVVDSVTSCGLLPNKKNYPIFYKVDQFITRKTSRDAVDIGGDDWAQSHVLSAAQRMPGIKFNDFSTQYGGKFYPHKTHQLGLDADFTTEEYAKLENKSYKYLGNSWVQGTQTCSTNIKTKNVAKKLTYSFLDSLKDDFAHSYRDIDQVAGTFYVSAVLSEQKTNVECPKEKVDDPTEYQSSFSVGTVLLAEKQILRTDLTSQDDLRFLKNRTCLGRRTLNSLLDSNLESVAGHADHWHIDWHSFEKRLPDEYPFGSEKYETKAEVEYDGDQASLTLTVPQYQDSNVYVDIYFLDSNGKENRLFQYDPTEEVRLATCHDQDLKTSSGNYESDISWCNEGWDFLPTPIVSGRTLTFEMPKSLLQQSARKLEDLRVRYVTALENSSQGYCKEEEGFFVDPISSCADASADPGLGEIHPNGGGFVAYNAYAHPGAFIGAGSRVCPGSKIESAEVELFGNTIISGNTSISGCVTISSSNDGNAVIKGFGTGVKITNDCSKGPSFRTMVIGKTLIEGEVEIVSPARLDVPKIFGHIDGTTGASKIVIDGTCNQMLSHGDFFAYGYDESLPEPHIQGPVHLSNCVTSFNSQLKGLRAVGFTGENQFYESKITIANSIIEGDVYLGNEVGVAAAYVKSSTLVGPNELTPNWGYISGYWSSPPGVVFFGPVFRVEDSEFRGSFFVSGANVKNSTFDCFPYLDRGGCIVDIDRALNLTIDNMHVRGSAYVCNQTTGTIENEVVDCNGIRQPITIGY